MNDLWVWGVDVSTKRIAIASHGPGKSDVHLIEVDKQLRSGARLSRIYDYTRRLTADVAGERPPLLVWVEQPAAYGRMPEPQLMYAVGVAQAAIYRELEERHAYPTEVHTLAVGEWKKAAIGAGNAKKIEVLNWAKGDGLVSDHICGDGVKTCSHAAHDAADAWGIARAGQTMVLPATSGQVSTCA